MFLPVPHLDYAFMHTSPLQNFQKHIPISNLINQQQTKDTITDLIYSIILILLWIWIFYVVCALHQIRMFEKWFSQNKEEDVESRVIWDFEDEMGIAVVDVSGDEE